MDVLGRAGAFLLIAAFFPAQVFASSFVADFSSTALWDTSATSTVLWDTVGKRLRAPVAANGFLIAFGDGSDGAFDSDDVTQSGITVTNPVGPVISFNTSRTYKFSSFNLKSGATIKTTGSAPLLIQVMGNATIAGTIDVSGSAGTINNGVPTPAPGGTAGPGGGAGGDAGFGVHPGDTLSFPGSPGSTTMALGGGNGAFSVGPGVDHGGGGGCYGNDGIPANDAAASIDGGGTAGLCLIANSRASIASGFNTGITGGAGGGGGGSYAAAGQAISGSGGGGGGGVIHLTVLGSISFGTNPSLGTIKAKGGDGGSHSTFNTDGFPDCGGGGGGGSGGAIWIQSAGTVGNVSNPGTIDVSQGLGGTDLPSSCGGGADGGQGSLGVFRLDAAATNGVTGATINTVLPAPLTNQTYTITSKPIDAGVNTISYATPTETIDTTSAGCGAGTLSVQYEGSNDATNFSGDVTKDQITILDGYRYIRFKTTITTSGSGTAPCLTGLSIPFGSNQFQIKGGLACGSTQGPGGSGGGKKRGSPFGAAVDFVLIALAGIAAGARPRVRKRA